MCIVTWLIDFSYIYQLLQLQVAENSKYICTICTCNIQCFWTNTLMHVCYIKITKPKIMTNIFLCKYYFIKMIVKIEKNIYIALLF